MQKGVVIVDANTARTAAGEIKQLLDSNPQLAAQFQQNPRLFLGGYGLNGDVQNELLSDPGAQAKHRYHADVHYCWFSSCCITTFCWYTHATA